MLQSFWSGYWREGKVVAICEDPDGEFLFKDFGFGGF